MELLVKKYPLLLAINYLTGNQKVSKKLLNEKSKVIKIKDEPVNTQMLSFQIYNVPTINIKRGNVRIDICVLTSYEH